MLVTKANLESFADARNGLGIQTEQAAQATSAAMTIALFDWSQLIEDYLDNIGVSFDSFCEEMSGGWMFGYISALRSAGVRTVLFCVSARVNEPVRRRHRATGATICVLPATSIYRVLRRRVLNPYASTVEEAVGEMRGAKRAWWVAMKDLISYFSTPPIHLARELRREQCEAILCQEYEHARFDVCLFLGRLLQMPVFATFQGGDESLGRIERFFRRSALRACRGLIIPTQKEALRVKTRYAVSNEKISEIFNPLDLTEWIAEEKNDARAELKIPSDARIAVWHGRIDYQRKGLDVLLEAWQRICSERAGENLRLFLIGTGNNADQLRAEIARIKPQNLVWIDEYVNEPALIRRYLSAADVYAFPSRHEGFAVAPLEAMSCNLPLVASDLPGLRELFEVGDVSAGFVVPPGNVELFARSLGRLLDDETLSRQMGERARLVLKERFAPEIIGAQLSDFLRNNANADLNLTRR